MGITHSHTNTKLESKFFSAVYAGDHRKCKKYLKKNNSIVNSWCYDEKLLHQLAENEKLTHSNLNAMAANYTVNPIHNPQAKLDPQRVNQNPKFNPISSNQLVPLTALMICAQLGHNTLATLLIESGAIFSTAAEDGRNSLMIAAFHNKQRIVQEILQQINIHCKEKPEAKAALLDAQDETGQTALLRASSMGYSHIMEILVNAGANVNIEDKIDGMSALQWASEHGPSSIVQFLIDHGADVNHKNHHDQTPLIRAASKDYSYKAKNSSTATQEDDEAKSIISLSSRSISSPSLIVDALLRHGANVNARNHDHYTALMVATW